MREPRLRRRALVVLAAAALLLGACGSGPNLPGYGARDTGGTETEPGDTGPESAEPSQDAMLTVTDVAVEPGAESDVDQVVLSLDGTGTPGWQVEYVDEAIDDGSGDPVDVAGDAILQIVVTGTAMPMDSGVTEYDGAPITPDDATWVAQVVYRFVFEGRTTVFVGVDGGEQPFSVTTSEDPTRLVVDIG